MTQLYGRWMERWENKLATRDTNRVVRPFEWGAEWLDGDHPADPAAFVSRASADALADSDRFFSYPAVRDYALRDGVLTFSSPIACPYPENGTARALWLPAKKDQGRALVVLPQWNSGPDGHVGLARLLNRFGISALRLTMPYHAERMPAGLERADFHVSSNVGRTIHASRQSVADVRACVDWLQARGYTRLGVLGTSLGSCIAFIAAAHDQRLRVGIFNHVSMYFSDVVWTGLSTRNVRDGFAGHVTQDELRRYWAVISPASYMKRLCGRDLESLLIWARHDSTFLPAYSRQVLEQFRALGLRHRVFALPCGHYTTGQFPFNLMDGLTMCRFAARWL